MKSLPSFAVLVASAAALALLPASAGLAQCQQASPDQRLDRLEKQVSQMQRQVFPKGRPADTAGFADDPAAPQSSVLRLDQRLDALEKQMQDILRQSEENSNTLRSLQSDIASVRSESEARSKALDQRISDAAIGVGPAAPASNAPTSSTAPKDKPKPKPATPSASETSDAGASDGAQAANDPAEDAYTEGFKLWEAGNYGAAITSLKAFTAAYPGNRRVSFANNLIGRALLDNGKPREAADALLSNYRKNPKGERAPDSLYYLGQALVKLGQPGQACKAYSEFDAVYGAKARADLKKLVADAETDAHC